MKSLILIILSLIMLSMYSACNISEASANDLGVKAYQTTPEGLTWYAIEDLDKMKNLNKRVMIDMYTTWCGWCKVMDRKTFTDPEVIEYLNKNFVIVKFNAEQRESVTFKGETYEWLNTGRKGVNKLALKLMNGRMGYPTMVYLDSNLNPIKSSPGYKTPEQLLGELQVL